MQKVQSSCLEPISSKRGFFLFSFLLLYNFTCVLPRVHLCTGGYKAFCRSERCKIMHSWGIKRKETWLGTAFCNVRVLSCFTCLSSNLIKQTNKTLQLVRLSQQCVKNLDLRGKEGKCWNHLCAQMQLTFHKILSI